MTRSVRKETTMKGKRSLIHIALMISVLTLSLFATAITTMAAAKTTWEGISQSDWIVSPTESSSVEGNALIFFDALGDSIVVSNAKSSNKKVATVKANGDTLDISFGTRIGKTTITFKVNGVSYKHDFKVSYVCPVSQFKVGKLNCIKTFRKKNIYLTSKKIKNQKLTVKCKKNWVITHVQTTKNDRTKSVDVKNKKSYTLKKFSTLGIVDGVMITFKNTKTGMEQILSFSKKYDMRYATAE